MKHRVATDPFLFGLSLFCLGFLTIVLAMTWRAVGDPWLLGLTVLSTVPAFWLFYQRSALSSERSGDRQHR